MGEVAAAFYEAVAGGSSLCGPVEGLLRHLEGSSGSLLVFGAGDAPPELVTMPGYSEEAIGLYAAHFHRVDLWAQLRRLRPTMWSVLGQDHVPADLFERSEVWNDFSRPHVGAFHLLGAGFPLADGATGCLGLHRLRDQPAFDREERQWLDALLPHLRSALVLDRRLRRANARVALAEALLDVLDFGLVVCRRDGTVVIANAAAVALEGTAGAFRLGSSRLAMAPVSAAAGRALRRLIRDAADGGPGGIIALPGSGDLPVAALVTPLPAGILTNAQVGRDLALVLLSDLTAGSPPLAGILRALFALTAAEAALAEALMAGRRPEEIARERGVTMATVRSQLRMLFEKTRTTGQVDLVRLVARLRQPRGQTPARDQVVR